MNSRIKKIKESVKKHKNKRMNTFVLAAVAGIGILFGAYEYCRDKYASDKFLNSFSPNLQAIGKIEKYPVENSRYCLVHIKDFHGFSKQVIELLDLPNPSKKLWAESESIKMSIQEEIYSIVKFIINNKINGLYLEGICSHEEEMYASFPIYGRSCVFKGDKKSASIRLYEEGVELYATEPDYNSIELKESMLDYLATYDSKNLDPREDAVLETLSRKHDRIKMLVFGGGHDFYNNIEIWNKEHPSEKYCLIEVSPKSYLVWVSHHKN